MLFQRYDIKMVIFSYIFSSLLSNTLSSSHLNFSCEDVYKHRNWHLVDNQDYCGTYDFNDPHITDGYTILDPAISETPPTVDNGQNIVSSRILRGLRVGRNEYPWLAQILRRQYLEKGPFCGGSLITKRYVLTAAHCVVEKFVYSSIKTRPPSELLIRLGANKRLNKCDDDQICRGFEDFELEEIIIPENVRRVGNNTVFEEDISLVRLRTESGFATGIISPMCLPKCSMLNKSLYGNRLVLAGWGAINEVPKSKKQYPDVLQKFYPVVKSSAHCNIKSRINWDKVICTGEITSRSSACKGDSGGPMMLLAKERKNNTSTHVYYQIGILSFGNRRCEKTANSYGKDSVYTRVGYFMPWILDQIRE